MKKRLQAFWKRIRTIKRRYFIIGIIVLLLLIFLFRPRPNPANQPQYATAERQDIEEQVSGSGTLYGVHDATLHFQSGGQLAFLNVKSGDQVSAGEVLAGLDTRQLASTLQQAQNTLAARQADVDKTVDDIHLSQYGNGGFANVGSANETQTQRDARINAQKARDSAVNAVNADEVALQNATITSPIDGVVTQAPIVAGQTVSPADTIVQVIDFSQKTFNTDIDESDISKVKLGQEADFTLNAYGDKVFKGKVVDISPTTHTTTDGATVVTVKISADDLTIQPISGLGGTTNITVASKSNTLVIPSSALRGDNTVFVPNGSKFKAVKVTTGLQTDTQIEITSGLKEGDKVVTNPGVIKNATS